jgi:hypothetical protein
MRSVFLMGLGLTLLACNKPQEKATGASLTHQWAVKPGASLFVQVSLGTTPDSAADALMTAMPTVVHQLGERCKNEPGAQTPGVFALSFSLGKDDLAPSADPPGPVADCVMKALPEVLAANKEIEAAAPTGVVLHLEHAPG